MSAINPLRSRPPVEIPDRKAPTKAQKVAAYNAANGLCAWCGKPVAPAGPDVRWDHDSPRAISGDDSAENLRPLHARCHDAKTHGPDGDIAKVAHVKRQARLTAPKVKTSRSFRRPPGMKFDWSRGRYVKGAD